MLIDTTHSPNAKVSPLDWDQVTWEDGFWKDAFDNNAVHTIPHLQKMFEDKNISHVVENFRICAGETQGSFGGTDFGDGDFYKWMEAAMYTAAKTKDEALMAQLDQYIDLIGRAQLPDGYISTKQILGEREANGIHRFGNINDFEVYNFGHLFTAACLYKRLTGKESFLNIAKKAAAYLKAMYEENARTGQVQTAVCPSHYMGLIEMYRTTKDPLYLDLAALAIHLRDRITGGTDDNQDKLPVKEHEKIVGHAVRANYLYAGVADLCAEADDADYRRVLDHVWDDLMDHKIYITGGCGALYNGASPYGNFFEHQLVHQAYGYDYQLPNVTAYNETCASIGHVLWAYRMFMLKPEAKYFDAIERSMLNTNLAAVSLDGRHFFYENMLRRTKKLGYKLIWPLTRSQYILSYCCPPNLARAIAQSSEYAYTVSKDTLWFGLYGANRAELSLENGARFTIRQQTDYPYDGQILLNICRHTKTAFKLNIRIPGWLSSGSISWNGRTITLTKKDAASYCTLTLEDEDFSLQSDMDSTDTENAGCCEIKIVFHMPVRYTAAHAMVEEAAGQAAIERGPLVYCMESADTKAHTLDDLMMDLHSAWEITPYKVGGRTVAALETQLYCMNRDSYDRDALYQEIHDEGMEPVSARFIPYFAWDNRGFGEMRIWFPVAYGLHFQSPEI